MTFARSSTIALLCLAAASACTSDSSVAPVATTEPMSLGQLFAEMRLPGIATVGVVAPVASASISAPTPTNCAYAQATQNFVCPTVSVEGLTLSQTYWLLDASGTSLAAYDPAKVAALRVKSSLGGTSTNGGTALTMDQQQDLTLSGIGTDTHVLNGTSSTTMSGPVVTGGVTTSFTMTMSSTLSGLVQRSGTSGTSAWPKAGTITQDMIMATGGQSMSLRSTITFNGTSLAAVVITAGGVTTRCTIDMTSTTSACR